MEKALTKEEILAADDIRTEQVSVPEWGGHVFVRVMGGGERDAFEAAFANARTPTRKIGLSDIRARLAALTICSDDGAPLFTDADIAALTKKSAAALERVFIAAQRLNGLTDDDVKDLAGNSGGAPSGASGSS